MRLIDRTGHRYGRFTVVCRDTPSPSGQVRWLCHCECGELKSVQGSNLQSGKATACGCHLNRHGHTGSITYSSWVAMRSRHVAGGIAEPVVLRDQGAELFWITGREAFHARHQGRRKNPATVNAKQSVSASAPRAELALAFDAVRLSGRDVISGLPLNGITPLLCSNHGVFLFLSEHHD